MKLPRYLILALVLTAGLVLWSQFSGNKNEEESQLISPVGKRTKKPSVAPLTPSDEVIDLFPTPVVKQEEKKEQKVLPPPAPPPEPEPTAPKFPLNVMGAWWSDGERILILSSPNENINRFLCRKCQIKGSIKPDEMITPEWKLVTLEKDHLAVEWLPKHLIKHIELGDLQSEPKRNTVN